MLRARPRRHWAARGAVAVVLGAGFVMLGAAPASAHGLAGAQPTNYASSVTSVTPTVPGLEVRIRDLGARVEVQNETAYTVTILGYSGEPYLRVGPAGVFENERSPSVFLNRSQTVVASVPAKYSASLTPVWRRVGGGRVVTWHDHRVHWMGVSLPPAVASAPGRSHLISDWMVTLQYRGHDVIAHGELSWVPGPSALPRLALALGVLALIVAFGFTRWWGGLVALSLTLLAAIVLLLVAGEWSATSAGAWIAFLSTVYSILGALVAVVAALMVVRARREPNDAVPIVLVAAVILALGSGLADITALDRSQLPTTLSAPLARTMIALVIGASLGLLVTAARRLRPPAPAVGG